LRSRCDKETSEKGLNITLIATPAEGLAGRFVKIDRERYGPLAGITDKEYYTNSFHIPVDYKINAFNKIRVEAPYHALTNAGHISYVEMDGNPLDNLEAFEKIIKYMQKSGVGYGSVNHPVDRDPVCGYTGFIKDECPSCGRREGEGDLPKFERIRRITGYLVGTVDRFNDAKRAEVDDRILHDMTPETDVG
jgi:ribonucleoside-triphosphate reductase